MSGLLTHDHFLQQQEKQLHILFGPPGVGKTSFSRQICSQFSSAPKSSSFPLVLLFYVREKKVAEAKTLADLLSCYGLPDDDLDHNELTRLIVKSKGKGLQIIFDGLDERPGLLKDDESIVTRLLKGHLADSQIVVTSCPRIVTQLSELWHMASLYEVQDFGPEEVNEYGIHSRGLVWTDPNVHVWTDCVYIKCNHHSTTCLHENAYKMFKGFYPQTCFFSLPCTLPSLAPPPSQVFICLWRHML